MFTGLVQDVGTVESVAPQGGVTDVWVRTTFDPKDFVHGESIACDGCCLTVVEFQGQRFKVQAAPETLRRTTLGRWRPGTPVNLEKALRVGDRLGGHWVQGHVDQVATVVEARPDGGSWLMGFSLPPELAAFFIEKGSVAVDGVSLTVNSLERDRFRVQLIPETKSRTALGKKGVGEQVNVEADLVGKYMARLAGLKTSLTREQLEAAGFA